MIVIELKDWMPLPDDKDGKDNALGLVVLGDEYNIQVMESAAEEYIKNNFKDSNQDDVLDIFQVNRECLKQLMAQNWSKKPLSDFHDDDGDEFRVQKNVSVGGRRFTEGAEDGGRRWTG